MGPFATKSPSVFWATVSAPLTLAAYRLQPTQDLTIDAETGPTQYRVSLEGADSATVTTWVNRLVAEMRNRKELRNATSDAGVQVGGYHRIGEWKTLIRSRDRRGAPGAVDPALNNRMACLRW